MQLAKKLISKISFSFFFRSAFSSSEDCFSWIPYWERLGTSKTCSLDVLSSKCKIVVFIKFKNFWFRNNVFPKHCGVSSFFRKTIGLLGEVQLKIIVRIYHLCGAEGARFFFDKYHRSHLSSFRENRRNFCFVSPKSSSILVCKYCTALIRSSRRSTLEPLFYPKHPESSNW